jgi:hypothetical protein
MDKITRSSVPREGTTTLVVSFHGPNMKKSNEAA